MLRATLLLLVVALPVCAAPLPFPSTSKPRVMSRSSLIGTWEANWGGVRCQITLSSNGEYRCQWCGTHYVGSWSMGRDGRIWITETCRPGENCAWQRYALRLTRDSRAGKIVTGANEVGVRLERLCDTCPTATVAGR